MKVSVVVPTYQHADYIEDCLQGILAQRTQFPIEILIGEDGSEDGTREICQRIAAEHPHRVRLFLRDRADVIRIMGKPTGRSNLMRTIAEAKGDYIALCEGDDFWTDPLKLQKQVDFLDQHPGHMLCCHKAEVLKGGHFEVFPVPDDIVLDDIRFDDLLRTYNFFVTATVMFRSSLLPLPRWFSRVPFGDMGLYFIADAKGRMAMLPEVMAVWRFTGRGSWTGLNTTQQDQRFLRFFNILWWNFTPVQKKFVARRRMMILDRIAKDRFPDQHRLKRLYYGWLHFRESLVNFIRAN